MKYINLDFIKPDKDCDQCDFINNYCCFECEHIQIKDKHPNSTYTNNCEWIMKESEEECESEEDLEKALDFKIKKWGLE